MPDTFTITIIFIFLCAFLGAFFKGRSMDRCLKGFSGFPVRVRLKDGERIEGTLKPENTGMEILYTGHEKAEGSTIIYKNEYDGVDMILCFPEELEEKLRKKRDRDFKFIHKRPFIPAMMRSIRNMFGTVRDSVMEVVNLFMGRVKGKVPGSRLLQGQDKYLDQIKQQTVSGIATSYEPILERYIGTKVVLVFEGALGETRFKGILKEYTPQFICMMDVDLCYGEDHGSRRADILVPRGASVVRHSSR